MNLLAISLGLPKAIHIAGQEVSTGIFKTSVSGRVTVSESGLCGDGQADLKNHGGMHKAVYSFGKSCWFG